MDDGIKDVLVPIKGNEELIAAQSEAKKKEVENNRKVMHDLKAQWKTWNRAQRRRYEKQIADLPQKILVLNWLKSD